MVVTKMRWAADDDDLRLPGGRQSPSLGILAFEAAATMAKLLSLHRSLLEKEVARLRSHTMRAAGVEYLSSTDQAFLLRLACAEAVAALDAAAASVARLGVRCGLDFAGPYASLKTGAPDARLDQFVAKGLKVKARKMERFVAATAKLCAEMEALDELEVAEQKLSRRGWGRLSGPIPAPGAGDALGSDVLRLDIRAQRARVRRLKEESLWSQSYEKAVILMARAACALFVRVCVVFGAYVPGLPPPLPSANAVHSRLSKLLLHPMSAAAAQPKSLSGPIQRRDVSLRIEMSSSSCPIIRSHWQQPGQTSPTGADWRKLLEPPPGTVGGAGLDLQYANVITTAERLLLETETEGRHEDARAELYAMLPSKLRAAVRAKLRGWWKERAGGGGAAPVLELDAGLAEGWRSAAGRILAWLAPMARDTARWHAERSMDRQRRFKVGGGARAWALQTLRWADAENAEAAVVELLVALSCVCWYEDRRREASLRF
ncbi:hypothetical protein E2562_007765 [Oryza meyeriana var. granulata]|uniref:DUF668 domain-containing protein n=1 Tax=Oryza meyeriana var. granulata TaxID=110450 RepID=A0A6G1EGR8_9ORYZ|nr:hypothetical protein E2562_007765 [Oryza meyeriana var. granulata]